MWLRTGDHYHLYALWASEYRCWVAIDEAAGMFLPALEPADEEQDRIWAEIGQRGIESLIRDHGWTLLEITPRVAWEYLPAYCERWGVPKPEEEQLGDDNEKR